jgi:hypothetical protein
MSSSFGNLFTFLDGALVLTDYPELVLQDRRVALNGQGITSQNDLLTSPKTLTWNGVGFTYTDITGVRTNTWDGLATRLAQLSAVAPNNLNATLLAVNKTIAVQNADTAPTRNIGISAGDPVNVGEYYGISWNGGALPFVMQTTDSTALQIKDTNLQLFNSTTPLTTTMDATGLTSGVSFKSWADIIAGSGSVGNLNSVLANGNTATGASAKIGLTDSGLGGSANPQLLLQNSNATAGATNGVPTTEYYKSGRNVVAGDVVASQRFNANNYLGTKTAFGRMDCVATSSSVGSGDDGALDFYTCVNGTSSLVFRLNGADNENNSFRPFDLNGNNLKTSSGNMIIETSASSGVGTIDINTKTGTSIGLNTNIDINASAGLTGNINLTAKASTGYINANSPILTNNVIATQTGFPASTACSISLAGTPNNKYTMQSNGLIYDANNGGTLSTQLLLTNDVANADNAIGQVMTDATGSVANAIICEQANHKILLNDTRTGGNKSIDINNNESSSENRITLFKNSGGGISNQAIISNQVNTQAVYLSNTNNSIGKDISLSNGAGGSLVYSNTEDNNGFSVASSHTNLTLQTTGTISGQGDIVFAPSQNGSADGQLVFTGASIEANISGPQTSQYLKIRLNGNDYKIALYTP